MLQVKLPTGDTCLDQSVFPRKNQWPSYLNGLADCSSIPKRIFSIVGFFLSLSKNYDANPFLFDQVTEGPWPATKSR